MASTSGGEGDAGVAVMLLECERDERRCRGDITLIFNA